MGLKPLFSPSAVQAYLSKQRAAIEGLILIRLVAAGELFNEQAKSRGSYRDVSGNLRSSVGYLIVKDGMIIREAFEQSGRGKAGSLGVRNGKEAARKALDGLPGFCIVVVAGMDYALKVESQGKDVISSSSADLAKHLSALFPGR